MKQTLRIAKNELYSLYYSPIAWVMMVIFLIMTSVAYTGLLHQYADFADRGGFYLRWIKNLTHTITSGYFGQVIGSLYLFFPLITMGLISREKNSGTIKLLYSSPVKIKNIVLGKFIAIVIFTIILIFLMIFTLVGLSLSLKRPDFGQMIASLIGLFFVLCTFAAIGLFISSLTRYVIVAAIITFGVFALLSKASGLWPGVSIISNITYYLDLQTKSGPLVGGLISSADIFYFLIITASFLSFTIIKLKSATESISILKKTGRYALVILVAFIVGFVSTRPQLNATLDSTRDQLYTITPPTQKTLSKLDDGELHITVFANLLDINFGRFSPRNKNSIINSVWGSYTRFKPNINIEFVYYYAKDKSKKGGGIVYRSPKEKNKSPKELAKKRAKTYGVNFDQVLTDDQVKKLYDVAQENYSSFFLLNYKDKDTVVRTFNDMRFWPSENEIAAAFKRIVNDSPKIIFLTGHGELSPYSNRQVSYKTITSSKRNRNSLLNQGYSMDTLSLQNNSTIPTNIAGLAIVAPKNSYSKTDFQKIKDYIDAGGNLFVAAEPAHRDAIQPVFNKLGLSLHQGMLVQSQKYQSNDVAYMYLTETAQHLSPRFNKSLQNLTKLYGDSTYAVKMKNAIALEYNNDLNGFKVEPLLKTHKDESWNRLKPIPKDSLNADIERPPGIEKRNYTTAVMMNRHIRGKKQIIIAAGDADYLTTPLFRGRPFRKQNYQFGFYALSQFSYGAFPANSMRPQTDDKFKIKPDDVIYQKVLFTYLFPFLIALLGSLILIRRKRK